MLCGVRCMVSVGVVMKHSPILAICVGILSVHFMESETNMFREDTDYVKRTLIVALGVVLILLGLFFSISSNVKQGNETKRAHYAACQSISSSTLRRDCITGARTVQQTLYAH